MSDQEHDERTTPAEVTPNVPTEAVPDVTEPVDNQEDLEVTQEPDMAPEGTPEESVPKETE